MCHPLSWGKQSFLVFFHVYGIFLKNRLALSACLLSPEAQTSPWLPEDSWVFPSGPQILNSPQVSPLPMEIWAVGQVAHGIRG